MATWISGQQILSVTQDDSVSGLEVINLLEDLLNGGNPEEGVDRDRVSFDSFKGLQWGSFAVSNLSLQQPQNALGFEVEVNGHKVTLPLENVSLTGF